MATKRVNRCKRNCRKPSQQEQQADERAAQDVHSHEIMNHIVTNAETLHPAAPSTNLAVSKPAGSVNTRKAI